MKWNPFNSSIGIALGGGGARGIAHIGVLRAFEDNDIKISHISGTSIGALVASYYAFGKSIDDIKDIGEALNFTSVIGLSLHKKGLFSTRSIEKMVIRDLGDVNIEDAQIPLAIFQRANKLPWIAETWRKRSVLLRRYPVFLSR